MEGWIKIRRIDGAFLATDVATRRVSSGNTWMEAVGALVATDPTLFGITCIEYDMKDGATRSYTIERDLDPRIV